MLRFIVVMLPLGLLVGCAGAPNVVPTGQDTFTIESHGVRGWSSSNVQKAKALQEANKYCKNLSKELLPLNTNETEGGFGKIAAAEVQFRCLNKGDPELNQPTMKPVANVRIENKVPENKDIPIKDSGDKSSDEMNPKLKKLKEFLDSKIITQDDFDAQKMKESQTLANQKNVAVQNNLSPSTNVVAIKGTQDDFDAQKTKESQPLANQKNVAVQNNLSTSVNAVAIRGAQPCENWIRNRQNRYSNESLLETIWLVGYLSGIASAIGKNFIAGTDNDSISLWVDNYCKTNPSGNSGDAGESLARELIKQKHL